MKEKATIEFSYSFVLTKADCFKVNKRKCSITFMFILKESNCFRIKKESA